MIGLPRISIKK